MSRRAVITGLGPITCCGTGKAAFWAGLQAQRSGITRLEGFDTTLYRAHCAGQILDWEPAKYFPPHRLKRLDRYAQFAVASAILALADAGIDASIVSPENPSHRMGVSFGTALAGISNAEGQHALFVQKGPRFVHPTLALQVFGGSAHSNIAIECGLRGVGTTNSNSCASGTVAIGEALRYIRDGWADVMVAGAAEAPLSPLTYGAFAFIKTMSTWQGDPAQACRPFDLQRDGFVMGEGAASLILEEYEHAKKRGAHIYGEVLGFSLNNDAHHMTTPLPGGDSGIRAITDALADARVNPEQIDYINGHASSTQMNDSNECFCVQAALGADIAAKIPISGTKPYTAHPLGATGAMEGIICALALEHDWVPPTLNYETPDPACPLDIVPNEGREKKLHYILTNSFGFGGINSCAVFGKI